MAIAFRPPRRVSAEGQADPFCSRVLSSAFATTEFETQVRRAACKGGCVFRPWLDKRQLKHRRMGGALGVTRRRRLLDR